MEMKRYHIVRWMDQIPFAHERTVENDDQAIGCAGETAMRHIEQWGDRADALPHIHVYEVGVHIGPVRHTVENFIAAFIPCRKSGELGYLLNHPAAQGRKPNARDLET